MSRPLLEASLRPDWQALEQERTSRNAKLWRACQLAVAGAALLMSLLPLFLTDWSLRAVVSTIVMIVVLWLPPLWYIFSSGARRWRALGLTAATCLLVIGAGLALVLPALRLWPGAPSGMNSPLILVGVAAPISMWLLMRWIRRRRPGQAGELAITSREWRLNLAIGTAAGAALGLHLLLTGSMIPGIPRPVFPGVAPTFWLLCYLLGPRLVGEELLFRGLGVRLLSDPARNDAIRTTLRIALVNLYVYLIPLAWPRGPAPWAGLSLQLYAWSLIYGALLALTTTALRIRQGSLVPGVACNVVFGLCIALVIGA